MKIIQITALVSILVASIGLAHGDSRHEWAESLAQDGNIAGMAAAFRDILDSDSTDTRARLGYAKALSLQSRYKTAEKQYARLLKQQPDNLQAMVGMGYNYIWSDQVGLAEQQFRTVLRWEPENFAAQKGLAFTYLLSDRALQALVAYQSLKKHHPDDLEIQAAIELAELGLIDCDYTDYHVWSLNSPVLCGYMALSENWNVV